MKAAPIEPFITATENVFKTMTGVEARPEALQLKNDTTPAHDVTGVISIHGSLAGSVALSFTAESALAMAGRFAGTEFTRVDADVADAVGELVNMIAGGAKAELAKAGVPACLSLPQVIIGREHRVWSPPDLPIAQITFNSDAGSFTVDVRLKEVKAEEVTEPRLADATEA